ncbi:MAG: tRNA (guanosine-2'-O-)-methyltransferase [Paracoccaceae bacterium]|jgi:tRNA (guanosine-2'-O-)-methyltransferase
MADIEVTIPMVGMVQSFNVSVAAGIIFSELQRQLVGLYESMGIDRPPTSGFFLNGATPS